MSFVFSKNKEKRSRSSTGVSNSFVRNVTSRVSGLLPAGITKWFSSPSSSRTNGSAAVADGTDSSTEDEAPESPIIAPPAKRLRFSSPVNYSQLTTSETTLTSNVITESGSVLYQTIQSPPGRTTYRQETNFNSTPKRAQSEGMNINTMTNRSETDDLHQQNTVSVIEQSKSLKRKSLFNNNDQQEQALMACAKTAANIMKDPKQPHFKPNLLCSPFYSGRTMYGGASSSTYINEPNIKHRKMTYVNESKDTESVNLSNSSRRVMDLLENYSSPLIDARRIPRYELSELTDVNRSLPDPNTSNRNAYKTQELYIPSTASVIRMKARSRLMDSTKAARQIIASHSSTLSFHGYDPIDRDQCSELYHGKSQSKLKTRLTRASRGDPFGMPESLDLPTAVLQIDNKNLPNFSFGGSVPKTSLNPPSSEPFKFSSPLPVNLDRNRTSSPCPAYEFGIPDKAAANKSPPKFSFGNQDRDAITNPLTDSKELIKSQSKEQSVITFAKAATKSYDQVSKQIAPKANETTAKCSICKLANSQTNSDKCVNCEKNAATAKPTANQFPVANKTSTKWICRECWVANDESKDKCVCCGSRNSEPTDVADKVDVTMSAAKAGADERVSCDGRNKWKCCACWVENDNSTDNCVCCGSRKSKKPNAPAADVPDKVDVVMSAAKAGADERISCDVRNKWKCRDCWVENDNSTDNCVCCGSRNPTKPNAPAADVPDKVDVVMSAAKSGADERISCDVRNKWKCRDCWVENDNNTDNCVCCGSRNSKKPTALPAAVPKKVDLVTSAATKDWRCDDCMITNKPSIVKCAACGGAKPGTKPSAKSLPSFSSSNFFNKPDSKLAKIVEAQKSYWECSVCLASNENEKSNCMCCETAKDSTDKSPPKFTNFKFDVKSNSSFKFGIDPKVQEKNLTKKIDEKIPKKMEESETNNNIIAGTPNFTFTSPAKNKDYKFDGPKTNEDPKPSFSFGIPTQNSTSSASNFNFKPLSDTKLPDILKPVEETEKPEKPQEVPSISLKAPEIAKPVTGLFAAPAPTANPLNAMNAFLNNTSEIKAVSPNKKETKPQFSFSAVKPTSGGLFAPPASVAASSLTTQDTPSQPPMLGMFAKTDATVPSPTVSFFSKSENPTPAPSPFQNSSGINAAPAMPATAAAPAAAAAPAVVPSMFSFGSNQSSNSTSASSEPKKFNFTFGSSTTPPMFGATPQSNSSAFGLTTNQLSNGPATTAMGGNGISSNPLGSGMSTTPLGGAPSGNGLLGSGGTPMFNAPAKENTTMWPNTSEQTNQANPFLSTPAKPQFTFGATSSPSPFGTPANNIAQAPIVFGAPSQPAQNVFGMNQNNPSQPSMFSNPTQTQQGSSLFGNSTLPMFGVPNASPFGTSTPSMSTFEAPAMAPASTPGPAFNFGAPHPSPAVFGFGQQPGDAMQTMPTMQTMQTMQGVQGMQAAEGMAGGFSFGATPAAGQMQFSIGSAPSGAAGRRVRKAVRRNPQR